MSKIKSGVIRRVYGLGPAGVADMVREEAPIYLRLFGKIIIDDIVRNIRERRALDGGPQKTNAPATILDKGHDHPLIGKEFKLVDPNTYGMRVDRKSDRSVLYITIGDERRLVAERVENLGYRFYGISAEAERKCLAVIRNQWMPQLAAKAARG